MNITYPTKTVRNRNILRKMARHNMELAGIERLNNSYLVKGDKKPMSRFARLWRQYITMPDKIAKRLAKKQVRA
jgi:hypothetical protein